LVRAAAGRQGGRMKIRASFVITKSRAPAKLWQVMGVLERKCLAARFSPRYGSGHRGKSAPQIVPGDSWRLSAYQNAQALASRVLSG
jgi:hypothetical protein